MKNLIKIVLSLILVLFIGVLFAYKSMSLTYEKVNKEQVIVEVRDCNQVSS